MALQTNLKHIENADQWQQLLDSGAKAAIVCGRMGPMCVPVYDVMENLERKYEDVQFLDMAFDSHVAMQTIRSLPETSRFQGLPFTVYLNGGKVVAATSSIQTKQQVKEILNDKLA